MKRKNKGSTPAIDTPILGGHRRAKSGSKVGMLEDANRSAKRTASLRTDTHSTTGGKHNLSTHLGSLERNYADYSSSSSADKNLYKGGKLGQEFYYKTISLAHKTLDRKELNSSINQKGRLGQNESILNRSSQGITGPFLPQRPGDGSASKDGSSMMQSQQQLQDYARASPLVVQKRANTVHDILMKKIEARKTSEAATDQRSNAQIGSAKNPHSMTLPLQPWKPQGDVTIARPNSGSKGMSSTAGSVPIPMPQQDISSNQQQAGAGKDKRATSTSFYGDKKNTPDDQSSASMKPHSLDPKRGKQISVESSKKKVSVTGNPQAVTRMYGYIDNIKKFEPQLPPFEQARTIVKDFDKIKAFSVNTHQGTVRAYNEDRVSILLNAQQR